MFDYSCDALLRAGHGGCSCSWCPDFLKSCPTISAPKSPGPTPYDTRAWCRSKSERRTG